MDMEHRENYIQQKQRKYIVLHKTIQRTSMQIKKYTNINTFTVLAWLPAVEW